MITKILLTKNFLLYYSVNNTEKGLDMIPTKAQKIWQSEDTHDPNIYADLSGVLIYLNFADIPEAVKTFQKANKFAILESKEQLLIKGDGISWFIQNCPGTASYFYGNFR